MWFSSPFWLIALIGWFALAIWLLLGRRTRITVPFLPLWEAELPREHPKHQWETPPLAILAILGAVLLAILSAAEPMLAGRFGKRNIVVIVDRGLRMSVADHNGKARFVLAAETAAAAIRDEFPNASIDLRFIPPSEIQAENGNWLDRVKSVSRTAFVGLDDLQNATRSALASSLGPVLVLSDQNLPIDHPRLVRIAPDTQFENVGIDSIGLNTKSNPQAMIRVENESSQTEATLVVRAGGQETSSKIQLPATGERENCFVDLPSSGEMVEAEILANDDDALNHRAWAVRRGDWPKIQTHGEIPSDLKKMIEVYSRHRPAGNESREIVVSPIPLPPDISGIIVPPSQQGDDELSSLNSLQIDRAIPSTDGVDWGKALEHSTISDPPHGDWKHIVTIGGEVAVAVRTDPARQVWIGFHSADFDKRDDFVVFWSEVFDWLGEAGPDFLFQNPQSLGNRWKLRQPEGISLTTGDIGLIPGIYQQDDGKLLAINAPPMPAEGSAADWQKKLKSLPSGAGQSPLSLSSLLLLTALVLTCVAAAKWRTANQRNIPVINNR